MASIGPYSQTSAPLNTAPLPEAVVVQTKRFTYGMEVSHPPLPDTATFSQRADKVLKEFPSFNKIYNKVEGLFDKPIRTMASQVFGALGSNVKAAFTGKKEAVDDFLVGGGHTFGAVEEMGQTASQTIKQDIAAEWQRVAKLPQWEKRALVFIEAACLYAKAAFERIAIMLAHRL